jgi:ketosteroid isomerase-like protein
MSRENVEIVARGYAHFGATGELLIETLSADFVWDMSKFEGWPERPTYDGIDGAKEFIADWTAAWDDWKLEVKDLIDAGDQVVAIVHQQGRSKVTGVLVEMDFAQVWSLRDGAATCMEMYSDVSQAFEAVGLPEADIPVAVRGQALMPEEGLEPPTRGL